MTSDFSNDFDASEPSLNANNRLDGSFVTATNKETSDILLNSDARL